MDEKTGGGRVDLDLRKRPRSEVVAFGKVMAALETLKSKNPLIGFQVEVYEDATVDVPMPVLIDAARRLLSSGDWRPTPPELLRVCRQVIDERVAALKYDPSECEQCNGSGWEPVMVEGIRRVTRCGCWRRHQEKVQALNAAVPQPLALPARTGDFTQVGDDAA